MNASRFPSGGTSILPVPLTNEQRKAYYNKIAPFYDLFSERSERVMRELGLAVFSATSGEHVLEIGFGTGHCLATLAEAVGPQGKVYGIDLSERMLARSYNLLRQKNLLRRVELLSGDAEHLPYLDGLVDGIFMSFTLELFDTPEIPVVLAECRRVLKDGGRLVVVGMSREGAMKWLTRAFEWTHRHFLNLLDCRPIYVRRALEAAGFQIEFSKLDKIWIPVEIVRAVKTAV